jgi:hypothetical protein
LLQCRRDLFLEENPDVLEVRERMMGVAIRRDAKPLAVGVIAYCVHDSLTVTNELLPFCVEMD